jgi:hypothetical protein
LLRFSTNLPKPLSKVFTGSPVIELNKLYVALLR